MNTFLIALGIIVFLAIVIALIKYFGQKSQVETVVESVPPVNNLTYETVPTRTFSTGTIGNVGSVGVVGASAGAGARVSGGAVGAR